MDSLIKNERNYRKILKLLIGFIFILNSFYISANNNQQSLSEMKNDSLVSFNIDNFNFLKNVEYFNPIVNGYSDLGLFLSVNLNYNFSEKLLLKGGVHFLKYSGEKTFSEIQPIFSVNYRPSSRFRMIMGTLEKVKLICLPDPIYFNELFWRDNIESGIQFRFEGSDIKGDLWVDWENYIYLNSKDQEQFTLGSSFMYSVFENDSRFIFDIPGGFIFNHKGGQINISDEDLQSIANSTIGLDVGWKISANSLNRILFKYKFLGYSDISHSKNQYFSKGFGNYFGIDLYYGKINIFTNYWYGYHFMSAKGNPIYMSVSSRNEWYTRPVRKLLVPGISYKYHIYNSTKLSFEFTSFYDIERFDFDYSFFIMIQINLSGSIDK